MINCEAKNSKKEDYGQYKNSKINDTIIKIYPDKDKIDKSYEEIKDEIEKVKMKFQLQLKHISISSVNKLKKKNIIIEARNI